MDWLTFILLMYLQVFVIFLEIASTIQYYYIVEFVII